MRLEFPKLFEADPFQGVDPDELKNRKEQQKQNLIKQRKKWIESMPDVFKEALEYIPIVREVEDRYAALAEDMRGNYGQIGDDDRGEYPYKVSFNIKIYDYDIPDDAQEKLDKYHLWDAFGQYIQEERATQLEWFVDGLKEDYPFVADWAVDGRSGGWLVLELEGLGVGSEFYIREDIDTIISDLEELIDPDMIRQGFGIGIPSAEQIDLDLKALQGYVAAMEERMTRLRQLEEDVERGRKAVEKMYDQEWFDNFFEPYADEMEDDEVNEMRLTILMEAERKDPFQSVSKEDLYKRIENTVTDNDIMDLEQDILDAAKKVADDLYDRLEMAYSENTDDEGVADYLINNDIEIENDNGEMVYFNDLKTDDEKDRAIEEYRERASESAWDWIGDDLNGHTWKDKNGNKRHENGYYQDELEKLGFEDPTIYLSGFWSQGDGCSFECSLDVEKVVKSLRIEVKPAVQKAILDGMFYGKITQSGHYYHSNTMSCDLQYEGDY